MKVYVCSDEGENKYVCATESLAKAWLLDQIFGLEADKEFWLEWFDPEDPDAYDWDSCSAYDAFELCAEFTNYGLDILDLDCTGAELPKLRIEDILPSERQVVRLADILPKKYRAEPYEPKYFEYEPVELPRVRHL